MSTKEQFLQQLDEFKRCGRAPSSGPLDEMRLAGEKIFAARGIPTTSSEEWRFTSLAALEATNYEPGGAAATLDCDDVLPRMIPGTSGVRVVLVNGRFVPELSSLGALPKGVSIVSLEAALRLNDPVVLQQLGRSIDMERHPFQALNTGFLCDGVVIRIEKNAVCEVPIHVLHVSVPNGTPTMAHPRVLIIAEPNSQSTIIEDYTGPDGCAYFTNVVTEVVAGEYTVLDHYKLQREGSEALHIGGMQINQDRNSSFSSHSMSFGAKVCRNDVNAVLSGEGAEAILNGLYVVSGEQLVDNHMHVDHAEPHCDSHELYKGVLRGKARGVFNGRIVVRPHAQKTNARQTNNNLLFDDALVNSNPQLEIFADDVKCSHGSTVGRLSDESMFYLRSRGIGEREARDLLTYAFAYDVISRIKVDALRLYLERLLLATQSVPAHLEV